MAAAQNNAVNAITMLLNAKAAPNRTNNNGYTALDAAVINQNPTLTHILLASGADPNLQIPKRDPIIFDLAYERKEFPDDLTTLSELLQAGASAKALDQSGVSILHWVAFYGQPKSVQTLLQYGADPDMRSMSDGRTPIMQALLGNLFAVPDAQRLETQNLLIDASKSLNLKSFAGDTALSEATEYGNVQAVDRLMLRHADPNLIAGDFKETPLYIACRRSNLQVAKSLIAGGADPNLTIAGDEMPIHMAVTVGSLAIVELLVQSGSRFDRAEWKGDTPLHLAAFNGYLEIVKFLVGKDAPVNPRRISGETPLDLAVKANHQDIVDFLTAHGGVHGYDAPKISKLTQFLTHFLCY
jgi:ankyrin repeat protein